MIHKLKILTLLELSEKIKLKQNTTFQQKLGKIGKMILGMGISYGIFVALFYFIFKILFFQATINLFIFVIFLMQIISILSCSVTLSKNLYSSNDNMILLTYPVPHIMVYISKLLVCYILELLKGLIFIFPLFMAYMTINSSLVSFSYIFLSIIFSVILPLFPVLIGAILPIPIIYFKKYVLRYNFLKIIFSIILVVLLVLLTNLIINVLPDNIRIVALYNSFINNFNDYLSHINKFALFYNFIGNSIYGIKPFINFLFALLTLIGISGLSILISLPLFFNLSSSVRENSIQKIHKPKNICCNNTFMTFLIKELKLSIRNIGDFISNYLFLFIMPFILVLISQIYVRIDRNDLGIALTYGFLGLIALIMLATSNTASATAISSEGNEFGLLKTAPANTYNIVWSKTLVNFIISFVFLTISFIWLSIELNSYVDLSRLWLVYFIVLISNVGLILWSIELDILNPRLKEYESSQSRMDVKNFSKSILIGCIASIFISLIIVVVFMFKFNFFITFIVLFLVALVFLILRLYFLINYMNAYFYDIEM